MRSAENVLREIDLLVKRGVKEIFIVDDNFTVSKKRTIDICREVIARGYNIKISTPSGVFIPSLDEEVLRYLYQAGLKELQFGVENGNQEFLNKVIKKNLDLGQVKNIIHQAKKIGFRTKGFFLFGFPGETKQIMLDTLKYAFESGLDTARFYIFQPFPNTEAHKMALEMGAIAKDLDFTRLKVMTDVSQVETGQFTKEDVRKIFNFAYDILKKRNYDEVKHNINNILGWRL